MSRVRCVFRSVVLCVSVLGSLLGASPLLAQETVASGMPEPMPRNVIALAGVFNHAVEIAGSVPTDTGGALLRWTRRTDARWLGGEAAFGVELVPYVVVDQEPRAHGGGAHLLYEHRFLPERSVRPVARLGLGVLLTDYEVPTQASRTNASMFAGAGAEIGLGRASWLSLEYRFQHLTGMGGGERNPGIYTHGLALGFAYAF